MFRMTSRQALLFDAASGLPEEARRRLRATWAEKFQKLVLPVLLVAEGEFARLYADNNGRPNWSVARMLGLSILQETMELTDQEAVDALSFDSRWQHALGTTAEEAYLSRRSFVGFRSRLVEHDPEMTLLRGVFQSLGHAALDDLKITAVEQRLDSTLVCSNIRSRGRADLFGKTLRHFVQRLREAWPDRLEQLDPELVAWCEREEEGWFGKATAERARRLLQQRAEWAVSISTTFRMDPEVSTDEAFQLVERLIREHCDVVPGLDEPEASAEQPAVVVVQPTPDVDQCSGT